MKIKYCKILFILVLGFVFNKSAFAQPQLSVAALTACPCQTVTASTTWNNVSSITYSLYGPPAGLGGAPILTFQGSTFPIFNCTQVLANITYTLVGTGIYLAAPITNTVPFVLTIAPPAPMVLVNNPLFCHGSNVTITAPIGGTTYSYSGSVTNSTSASNVINIPNVQAGNTGIITVTSVIGGCTVTGQTNISVAPLKNFAIISPTNVCQNACATLTANLPGGTNYQWFDPFNAPLANGGGTNWEVGRDAAFNCTTTISDAGKYTVTADDQFNGILCPYTATTQLNVVQTNPVSISASPASTVCQGANINLLGAVGSVAPTSWQWSGPGFNSNSSNPVLTSVVPANTGAYSVTANFSNGFLNCTTSVAINLYVVPVSAPVITMPPSVCEKTNLFVSGSAGSNPLFYNWSGPLFTGTVPTSGQSFSVIGVPSNASGTQFLTVNFAIGAVQCAATSSAQLNVVTVNSVSVIPPGQVCAPNNAFLQSLATGAFQYLWTGPNNFVNPGANVWINNPTPASSGVYSVTASFGSGGTLVCTSSNTVQLTVSPVLNFSLMPRQLICYNTPFVLSGPPGATSYKWTSSTGFTSYTKDINIPSAQPNNSGTYTLEIFLGACKTSGESELVVLTPITFSLTPFDRNICRGDTIILEGGATGGSENYAYVWNPSVYLESPSGPKKIVAPLGSVVYNLIVHDIACPGYSIAHPVNIKVNQPPLPKLDLARGAGCEPFCLKYNANINPDSAIVTYDFGGSRVLRPDTSIFDYCLDKAGTYNLKIYTKGKNGCSGIYEHPYPIVVYPKPGADVYWNPETPTTNDEITFYPTFKSEPIIHYSWNFLGGATLGDTTMANTPGVSDTTNVRNPKRLYSNFGIYPVVLISKNEFECIDTVYKFVKVIDELQIYVPNSFTPNDDGINDIFTAKGTGMKMENFSMDIFNRAGVNVFSTKDINEGWNGKVGGQVVKDAIYIYKIKVVGMNGEGRKEYTGYFSVLK